ncbi:MAG: TVP38/TMEM64 family protein [Deltaproteobacteria bacterium]|nr:TVP38/TMEM64 family protein [Deltaproteobacteria bacterium]MBW2536100.1 TVP38/TMEM64 family protein [Deltaproteobacteria bacterium]
MSPTDHLAPAPRRGRPPARVVALGALVVGSVAAFATAAGLGLVDRHTIERVITEPGSGAMVAYVLLVIGLELLWCPRMWGLLAGGLLFGPFLGAALSLLADMLSASLCFAAARGGGRQWAAERLQSRPRARALVELLAHRRGMVTVALLRVLPFHYTAVSYASGVAGVSWPHFLLGTLAGALPGALLYNAVGDAARQPTSPVFVGGVIVLGLLGVAGLLWTRALWRGRRRLAAGNAEPRSHPDSSERSGGESPPAATGRGGGAEGN